MNNDVSVNAFSSDSPMDREEVEVGAGGGTVRYNKKNSSSYFITCKIHLFMIVSYSIQNAPKCTKMHDISFQILKNNVNIFCRSNLCKYNCETRGIKALSFKIYPHHLEHCIPTLIKLKACRTFCFMCHIFDS